MSSDLGTPYAGERIDEPATRSPACPACGRHSQPEAAFCAFCGTALVHQRVPGPPVFAAVATAISGRSAYDVLNEIGEHFEALGAVFEGVSHAPATLVALFPPREDAAAVAARAALELAERCPDARVGIDASEVTERSDQDAIWQDLIDRSVALGSLAGPGTIVAGEAIPPLTEGAAIVEPVDGVVGATWLRELRDLAAPADAPAPVVDDPVRAGPTPFAGRDRELEELRARFEMVREGGRAACIAVVGPPGIGTTRLVERFASALADARVFRLRCDPTLGICAWPLAGLIETFAGLTGREDPDTARATLERLLRDTSDRDRAFPRIAHMVGLDGGRAVADETRWAVRTLIEAAVLGPSVLVVDDVDRVAFGFAAFLGDVARALRSTPLLILCTATAEPVGVPDTITVSRLDDGEAGAVVAARLGAVDPDTATAIVSIAGGDPLLLEQGIALLVESSAIVRDGDRWVAVEDLAARGVGSARDAVVARLRGAAEDVRATAGLAALAGTTVTAETVCGEEIERSDAVRDHLATLVAMGLLEPRDDGSMRSAHPLIREVAAAGVPPAAAADLHRRLGRAESLDAGARRRRFAESAGSRLAEAARLDGGSIEDGDRADALDLLGPAAENAADLGDAAGAAILERAAATVLPKQDPRRAELMFMAATHEAATGRTAETEFAINDAIAAAIGVAGDAVDHHVRILRASVRAALDRGSLDAARAIADDAYERFSELDDDWGRSCAAALRGQVHAARGHAAAMLDDLLESAELARAAQRPADAAAALRGAGRALLDGPMPVEDAIARSELLRADAAGHPLAEQDLAGVYAVLLARRGRSEEARGVITGSIAIVEDLGADADLAVALHRSGVIWWLAGEFHAAEPPIQRALAAAAQARDDRLRARIAASWANLVLATEDRVDEAMALADVAETWATDPAALVGWRTARARALVRLGDVETADRLGRQAVSLAEQTDSTDLRANALLHLAEVLRLSGRPSEAAPFQRRALRVLDRKGATAQAAAIFRQLGPERDDGANVDAEELTADDDLDLQPATESAPAEETDRSVMAEPIETEFSGEDDPAELDAVAEPEPAPDGGIAPSDPTAPQPIAEAFAASSESERKKRGLFRR